MYGLWEVYEYWEAKVGRWEIIQIKAFEPHQEADFVIEVSDPFDLIEGAIIVNTFILRISFLF